jgi:hypothetical protein
MLWEFHHSCTVSSRAISAIQTLQTDLSRCPRLLREGEIKCDAVDIETLAIGSVYGNKLRRKVQDLAELRFLLPNRFFPGFALSDVHRYAPELDELSRCAENRMA